MGGVLTFDLGTSYFKVCLFDEDAQLVCQRRVAAPVKHSKAGQSELSASEFCSCLKDAVHEIARQVSGLHQVRCISFASQANSFILLDKNSHPIIPFILWNDERARDQREAANYDHGLPDLQAVTGVPELNHLFLPVKLAWLLRTEPQLTSRVHRLSTIGDYLVRWLTGNYVTEGSLAGLTGLADIHRLQWWSVATKQWGIPAEWLPEIVRAGTDVGRVTLKCAESLGISPECHVVMGCLDQFAGAIGAGNVEPGMVSETTGTVLATVMCTRSVPTDVPYGVYIGPASVAGNFYQMTFSSISASLLERYRNQLPDRPSFTALDQMASQVSEGCDGLRFDPSAADGNVADMFINRRHGHHRGHEVRAIMEGVAAELRRQVALLCRDNWPKSIRSSGGGARSKLWLEIKRRALQCPVETVECLETTSKGAAILAINSIG